MASLSAGRRETAGPYSSPSTPWLPTHLLSLHLQSVRDAVVSMGLRPHPATSPVSRQASLPVLGHNCPDPAQGEPTPAAGGSLRPEPHSGSSSAFHNLLPSDRSSLSQESSLFPVFRPQRLQSEQHRHWCRNSLVSNPTSATSWTSEVSPLGFQLRVYNVGKNVSVVEHL